MADILNDIHELQVFTLELLQRIERLEKRDRARSEIERIDYENLGYIENPNWDDKRSAARKILRDTEEE